MNPLGFAEPPALNLKFSGLALTSTSTDLSDSPVFHQFGELPGELRLKIWAFANSVPRTITITCIRPSLQLGSKRRDYCFRPDIPSPGTLHACQESRHEALSVYTPAFRTPRENYLPMLSVIYVSFSHDTIRVEDTLLTALALPSERLEAHGIQSLILDVKDSGYFGHFNMDIVREMPNLKDLVMWADKWQGPMYGWK